MHRQNNPFRPGFGISPVLLSGRKAELEAFLLGMFGGVGNQQRVLLISGPRGVGKTVLLNEFERQATSQGWLVLRAYPDAEMIPRLRDSTIPEVYQSLDFVDNAGKRTVTGISIGGIGSITTQVQGRAEPAPTLMSRMREIADAAREHGVGVLITLDELQAAHADDLAQLATALQDLIRDEYDVAFAAAGLTFGVDQLLEHPGTTFMRRAQHLELGKLPDPDVAEALAETAAKSDRPFEDDALQQAVPLVRGYPYLLQLVGAMAWAKSKIAGDNTIKDEHVTGVAGDVVELMGRQVHRIALKAVPDGEMAVLQAMARLEPEIGKEIPTASIAELLGKKPNAISVWRRKLIERDLITAPRHGRVAFTLPYLGEYLRSA